MHRSKLYALGLVMMALIATPAHAATFDLSIATIADINAAIDAGALSSEKLVGLYLKRIEAYDKNGPKVNSVITLNSKALAEARALDAERKAKGRRSPLHGIPIVVKDLIDVAGMPTTAGFKPFGAPVPLRDAAIVSQLKASGAIILAKVATVNWFGNDFDETHPIGASLNPYSLEHSPGGSSNGVGVSMAAWFAAVGVGTDTGGSVRGPSAFGSLAGMVATQGLVSRSGIVPRGATQDRAGPMGRSVYDIALLLTYMSGWDAEDMMTMRGMGHFPTGNLATELTAPNLKGRRIGVLRELVQTGPQHTEGVALFERALDDLRKGGAQIVELSTGLNLRSLITSAAGRTAEYEKLYVQNAYLERLGPNRPYKTIQEMIEKVGRDKFDKLMIDALSLEHPAKSADYAARVRNKDMVSDLVVDLVNRNQLDALVYPYSTLPPPRLDATGGGGGGGNSLASNSGLPSVLMPAGYTRENLPIAIEIIGKPFDDTTVLQVAYGYEQVSKRRKAPATTPSLAGEVFTY